MRFSSILVLSFVCAALAGCGSMREDLGLGRSTPDEFAVIDRPPLAIPPDFGLRPPVPGAPRPQEVDQSLHASDTLFGSSDKPAANHTLSAAERALVAQSGADKAPPDIRNTINSESTAKVDVEPHLVNELLWWKKDAPQGTVVNADAEAERIKQAKDKGEPINSGATPVIEKEKSGWLGL